MTKKLLMGNEAFAHAALEAGVNVVAGYPGTPSSEVIETISRLRAANKAKDVYVEWSTNEKAALEVAAAASISGARALFTCKQVGLNVASDALMSLNYLGVRGGLVIFVADDPGPISSQTEQDTRRFASFAKIPVLDPATPEQGFEMMKAAFDLSEAFKTPVIVRPTTRINHASTFFDVKKTTQARPIPDGGFRRDPAEWVIFPKRSYQAHGEIIKRLQSITHHFMYDPQFAKFNPAFERNPHVLHNGRRNRVDDAKVAQEGLQADDQAGEQDAQTASHDEQAANRAPANASTASAMDVTAEPGYEAGLNPTLGIMAGGVSTQYALDALDLIAREAMRAGIEVPPFRFMQIGTPYPFPRRSVGRFLKDLSDVLVLEELDSVLEEELLKVAGNSFLSPTIHGKLTGEANERGENSTEDAAFRIAYFFDRYKKNNQTRMNGQPGDLTLEKLIEYSIGPNSLISYASKLPTRPPVLCAGCPHRGSFYAMKNAIHKLKIPREDAIFCGDIGCYTLGNAMPLDAVDTCLCMGGGITMAQGFAIANPGKKNIAFVGDSTFFASGMTGIANAVYNQHDITVCVLDNSTTAMTGSQPHPGTGKTLMGGQSKPIQIKEVLKALGIKMILEVDPLDRRAAETACEKALKEPEPNAIIFKSPCVWLQPFDIPAKVHINLCTGCKKCIEEIGCPAIGFNPDATGAKSGHRGQAVIDQSQCNGCGLCLQVCPFHAIEIITPEEQALFESARLATEGKTGIAGSLSSRGGSGSSEFRSASSGAGSQVAEYPKRRDGDETQVVEKGQVAAQDVEGDGGFRDASGREDRSVRVEGHEDIGDTVPEKENVAEPVEGVRREEPSKQGAMLEVENAYEIPGQRGNIAAQPPMQQMQNLTPEQYAQYAQFPQYAHLISQAGQPDAMPDATMGAAVPYNGQMPASTASGEAVGAYSAGGAADGKGETVYRYSIKFTGRPARLGHDLTGLAPDVDESQGFGSDNTDIEDAFVDEALDLTNGEDADKDDDALDVVSALSSGFFLELDSDDDEDDDYDDDEYDDEEYDEDDDSDYDESDDDEDEEDEIPAYRQSRWGGRG